jgi:adenine-specific DNA-methyltransferase
MIQQQPSSPTPDNIRSVLHNSYQLIWDGKAEAIQKAYTPIQTRLVAIPQDSIHPDTASNMFIEGDNLEALKILADAYTSQVHCIYIDPPYNTGKDTLYKDRYTQVGKKEKYNDGDTRARMHTDWLNLMYPRLILAHRLLREDGMVVLSIGEQELVNLKLCCEEIFGHHNFINTVIIVNNPKGRSDDSFIATAHEYLLFFAKDIRKANLNGFLPEEHITRRYNKKDDEGRMYRYIDLRKTGDEDRREDRPSMFYYFYLSPAHTDFIVSEHPQKKPGWIEIVPLREDGVEGRWRWSYETACKRKQELTPQYMQTRKQWGIFQRDYLDQRAWIKPTTVWNFKDVNSERGSEQFIRLGFKKEVFPRPKPVGMLKRILEVTTHPNKPMVILDCFAGSCSLVEAAMELEIETNRQFQWIMIQAMEPLDPQKRIHKAAYSFCTELNKPPHLSEIGKERIRRVIARLDNQFSSSVPPRGFQVYHVET